MPLALAQSVTKPGAPVPAKSSVPAIIASLMTLPPSSVSQVTLMSPRPAALARFSRSLLVLHHDQRQIEDAEALGDADLAHLGPRSAGRSAAPERRSGQRSP